MPDNTPQAKPTPKPIGLPAVLAELQFFIALQKTDDPRVQTLGNQLLRDFLDSMRALGFNSGDDLPEQKIPTPNG
jgi:hypothetical protein